MLLHPNCPRCRQRIPVADLNVVRDVALCRACGTPHRLSGLFFPDAAQDAALDPARPPAGVVRHSGPDGSLRWRASHHSWLAGICMMGVTLFWNSIVSVFVLFALAATLAWLGVPVVEWLIAHGVKIDGHPSPGEALFLWLFLTPFIAIGAYLFTSTLSVFFGHTELRLGPAGGQVFVGIGPLGRTRRFDPAEVADVTTGRSDWQSDETQTADAIILSLRDGSRLKFGTLLPAARRDFLASALRQSLLRTPPPPASPIA